MNTPEASRRGFLKGTLVAVTAGLGTALVKLATPAEVSALAVDKPVCIAHTAPGEYVGPGGYVYDADGAVLGIITEVVYHRDSYVEDGEAGFRMVIPGLMRGELRAQLTGPPPAFRGNVLVKG